MLANLECLETQIRYVHCGYILEAILSDDDGYQLAILGHIEAGDVVVIATITVDSEMSHIRLFTVYFTAGILLTSIFTTG